jgi:hypothetical protein
MQITIEGRLDLYSLALQLVQPGEQGLRLIDAATQHDMIEEGLIP